MYNLHMQPFYAAMYNPFPLPTPARSNPLRYITSARRCISRARVTRSAKHGMNQAW